MKNIHLIPTDKPSRLALQLDCKPNYNLQLSKIADDWTKNWQKQNIYITSDEKVKEGDCCIITDIESVLYGQFEKHRGAHQRTDQWKKIILTTDEDLIKAGIQAPDDEFLQWLVKNPSCEEIEVKEFWFSLDKSTNGNLGITSNGYWGYKIIIPKEYESDLHKK